MKYLALTFLFAGCGAEIDDLYGEASSSGGDGTGASTSTSPSSGGAANSSSNAGGAPTSNNATTSNAGGMATTNVNSSNVATTGPDPSSSQQTTTGIPEGVFVQCGDGPCNVSEGNVCCLEAIGSSCVGENECGALGAPVECDDPFDCGADKVCCGHTDGGLYDEIRCDSQCEWPNRTLCALDGPACEPIPGDNGPIATQCGQSTVLPTGYLVCKP